MLLRVQTTDDKVLYVNENQIAYVEKLDTSVLDEESNWQVHLTDAETSFTVAHCELKRQEQVV
ncbi:Hypothetical protein ADU72_1687 [Pediococcus damnosus]|uniref:Uncharacterized protein n=1 Tax=Pediococcus damnosus TaxID=51663 RepID=A0A0R2HE01_9LACO|nr:hypothetical protein [Pediococcus damnosus]AMV59973.1 Hypothetical protein ADU69_0295 [Pediococcus damnosus]AMV62511.1 Hypothetical protein ADU70_1017 [Pediococcus damnosus]AMV64216.1 Hypothetical protein ADU71_0293 [Pediococcus damnosus]AMV67612.1 Hypothetical protein ADU72_1687 [Pediococcus damnosus]AMV69045.1 Hypothetical protein ADU73_0637 [Pediococcus damnosus]